ncbi:glycosyltransferase family 4 protein [Phyllobacterium sp. SB3]|uniref:glycosyltransferase family 4 protein n=1 Tax=Phyllobacterium sp. SB3 TaxID=3156073 RepID=UPI0032AEC3EA
MTTNRSLRIVHCFRAPVGGVFRHVRDLVSAQNAAGHQVGVICDATTGSALEEKLLADLGNNLALGLVRIPMQRKIGPGDAVSAFRTYKTIKKLKPDILHGHGAKGGTYARVFGSLLRVSGVSVARFYSPHGGSLHYDPTKLSGKLIFRIERLMERMTDRIIFVSQFERDTYVRKVGEPRCASALIHNGLSVQEFDPVVENDPAADFLFIGELRALKGPDIFIEALAKAGSSGGRKLTAAIVGDGKDRAALVEQAKHIEQQAEITFLPPMKAREAFRLAKIVIVPSRAEALPYIVLEALAAGKPLIASRVGGIPEILGDQSFALVRPDATELAQKMTTAIGDIAAYRRCLPDADTLRKNFSADSMATRLEAEYFVSLSR